MSNGHFPVAPHEHTAPWTESVLSTRSLSFLSATDASQPAAGAGGPGSRNTSFSLRRPSTHLSNMTDGSDHGLEIRAMDRERAAENSTGLPHSVAQAALFTLPREIRDRIYSLCLTTQDGTPIEWPASWKPYGLQPQLLRLCRIIYEEAAPMLYASNNMTFHHPSDANMFVRAFASTELSQHIAILSLHIKAQDTRIWMAYLTSRDAYRSLYADFPFLRELNIRFRSNKWQHSLPPESNLKLWCEDSRLDEIIYSLRHNFFPEGTAEALDVQENGEPTGPATSVRAMRSKMRRLQARDSYAAYVANQVPPPTIKLVCACRINAAQFAQLTSEAAAAAPPLLNPAHVGAAGQNTRASPSTPPPPPPPVREGEPFRGFTAVDLRHNTKKLHDPELGSATVARTPFADRNGILISLEVHSLDPRRDNPETRNV